ncbi:MAG: hydantoinase/oxoprolinase family protein [Chloroflexota bacterium]
MSLGRGPFRIGVDIGGTFSDFVILDESSGRLDVLKVPSTPADPSEAIHDGLHRLSEAGLPRGSVQFFSHGTTIATNALLEGKGAVTGLLITRGFRAVQEVQDQTRGSGPSIYDFFFERPPMLVPQERTAEVTERVDFHGEVVTPIDRQTTRLEVQRLLNAGVESFAVCLIFAFMNPTHEQAVRDIILELQPEARVSLSSEVLPMIREWFRLSTTQVNAYVAPRLHRYLRQMEQRLDDGGIVTRQRYVMQSNGGVTSFGSAADRAVTTVLSGPAAGVIAGARLAEVSSFRNVITFDIGGTSTDIALVDGGIPIETTSGRVSGYDVAVPVLDINTISAGGGTVAWVDEVGSLHCGPRSAGADPGPACYGKGGTDATTTDANLLLGYLSPSYFLGGRVALDPARAHEAMRQKVAEPLGLSVDEAAAGVIRLINVEMAQGVRTVSSERGYDLRDFALVAFGGAGPLHAGELAVELGLPCVIVPRYPGLTSALGLLMCDVKHDYARSRLEPLDQVDPGAAERVFDELDAQAMAELQAEGFTAGDVQLTHQLDVRYAGQGYELRVDVPPGPITPATLNVVRGAFDDLHERLHGHRAEGAPVEVVTYWTIGLARVPTVSLEPRARSGTDAAIARKGTRRAWFRDLGWVECPLYERERLQPGARLSGPAIVEQVDSTTVVHPGQELEVDAYDNMLIWVHGKPNASIQTQTEVTVS